MKKLVIKRKEVGAVGIEEIPEDRLVDVSIDEEGKFRVSGERFSVERRNTGEFIGKAIYLSKSFNYTFGEDNEGSICLVPLKKGEG